MTEKDFFWDSVRSANPGVDKVSDISDGHHTFDELYSFRLAYNAALFNAWHKQGLYDVHKSFKHHEGDLCFGGGWFIVVAMLPTGQISNHYPEKYWGMFNIPTEPKSIYPFDGHTPSDVLERLTTLCVSGRGELVLPYQQRVLEERAELYEKISKLSFFLSTDPKLEEEDITLLKTQLCQMKDYFTTLSSRVSRFKK
jgi:hypothetical protein